VLQMTIDVRERLIEILMKVTDLSIHCHSQWLLCMEKEMELLEKDPSSALDWHNAGAACAGLGSQVDRVKLNLQEICFTACLQSPTCQIHLPGG